MRGSFFVFAAVVLLAACGGGGGGGYTPPAGGSPTPSVSPSASPSPASQTATLTMNPSGPVTGTFSGIASGASGSMTLPATTSGTASATLTLQSALPSGDPTPAARKIQTTPRRQILGANVTPLVYVTLSLAAGVTISQTPSLTFSFPAGTLSGFGYVALYDPSKASQGWVAILGPVTASGTQITFPASSLPSAVTLNSGVKYVFAIVETGTPLPTPTPSTAPTSTPTTAPTSTPVALPAYCSNYNLPAPSSNNVTLDITDDSGLGQTLIVYVVGTLTSGGTLEFMDDNGNFTSSAPVPLAAACFKSTAGSTGTQSLTIPDGMGANGIPTARIYFAYATPNPSAAPNPFGSTTATSGPNYGYGQATFPWDLIEYGTVPGATIDTSQVSGMGLPLELDVCAPLPPGGSEPAPCPSPVVGVTSAGFANIFKQMESDPQYSSLVVAQPFGGSAPIDMQIVAPQDAQNYTSFLWNVFALGGYAPSSAQTDCPGVNLSTSGYFTCVLASYQAQPRLFGTPAALGISGVSGNNYCIGSDASANFLAENVGSAQSCSGVTPTTSNSFAIPVQDFTYGEPPSVDNGGAITCKTNLLFAQPWGQANIGGGHLFASADALALWKGLGEDLNRGSALVDASSVHPIGTSNPAFSGFFLDPMYNTYAQILHANFDGSLAYALAYDDTGNFESGVTLGNSQNIYVRINPIPTSTVTLPSLPVTPVATPNPCPTLQPGIGSFN